ncbi:MAG: extracellular solute-binding protein [Treponema sp.]|jgi:putative aldouronate transport system substrate-binding protein|nr:extracellular solute-binding protein [Treponema sp.]
MKKHIFSLIAAALTLMVIPGCNKSDKPADSGSAPVAITVEVFDRGTDGGKTDPTNNEWTKWIKAKVLKDENIDVTFVAVSRWTEEPDIVARMAAQDAPDLCYTYSMDNVRSWGIQGGVYDLASYVDTLLPDMKAMMGEDPGIPGQNLIWHSKDVDSGALYGISNKYVYTASHNTFIRKDWLDKLGLPLPKTTQEFYDTMVAFKNNPAKLGVDRVVPFLITSDIRWQVYNIFLSFMDPGLSFQERWVNTVAERQVLVPGVKEAYRFLNRMYNDGLIDRDFPLYADDTVPSNVMKSGIVGAFQHNWDQPFRQNLQIQTELEKNIPGAKFVPVDCFTNSAGLTPKRGSPAAGGLIIFVPKTSKNPEAAMRYANWLCRYENYHFLQFGNEGVNHELVNGVPKPISATGPWIQNSGVNVDYTMSINGYLMKTPEELSQVLAFGYPGIPPEDVITAYIMASTNAKQEPYVPATITSISTIRQVLVDKEKALSVNLICASPGTFDQTWDAGIKDWLTSGAQTVIDEQRAKYR